MRKLTEFLPLQIRILCRQFLLRVVDLEALSIQADIPRFLGQFASILVLISLAGALGVVMSQNATATADRYLSFAWGGEQALISGMMLVIGLISVITWDSIFPDRRDVMVLSPLPVKASTILIAKIAATAALPGVAIVSLNFATGLAWPLLIGSHANSMWGFFRAFAAYWFTMIAASGFVYGSVLSVQGMSALLFSRRSLQVSAMLQIAAFGLTLGQYFLVPSLRTPAEMALPENHWALAWSPSFWFFSLFNQLNGSLPRQLDGLAGRAWIGLGAVVIGASASLFLCYVRTMRKTLEEPDLVPGTRALGWAPRLGSAVQTAVAYFSIRSLLRSRQHRVIFAFYFAGVLGFGLASLRDTLALARPRPVTVDFLYPTFLMMTLMIAGLRSVFKLPISLNANWMWRVTQLRPAEDYLAATRRTLLLLGVLPVWIFAALEALLFSPLHTATAHLIALALVGCLSVELSLIGLQKLPFTCSYLPGKIHAQVLLGCFLVLLVVFSLSAAEIEMPALHDLGRYVALIAVLAAAEWGLWIFNCGQAKSGILHFEDLAPELITSLGLVWIPSKSAAGNRAHRDAPHDVESFLDPEQGAQAGQG